MGAEAPISPMLPPPMTSMKYIEKRVRSLKKQHVNKRKKHALRNTVHLDYLSYLYDNFVLVPADKASNNVIVVCKKYYLDVVIKELNSTSIYREVCGDCTSVVSIHLDYNYDDEWCEYSATA